MPDTLIIPSIEKKQNVQILTRFLKILSHFFVNYTLIAAPNTIIVEIALNKITNLYFFPDIGILGNGSLLGGVVGGVGGLLGGLLGGTGGLDLGLGLGLGVGVGL
jgi:hypothetical protein